MVLVRFFLVWIVCPAGPAQSPGGGPGGEVSGSSTLQYLKLCLNNWMVVHFFMCIAVQSHKRSEIWNSQFSYEQNVWPPNHSLSFI